MAKMSPQPKGNNANAIVIAFASVIGGLAGFLAVDSLFKQKGVTDMTIEQQLVLAAKKLNEGVPRQIDRDTRLDSIVAGPGAKFNYNYTLINLAKSEVDVEQLKSMLRQQVIETYKTSQGMKDFRQNNVLLVYKYSDKSGVPLFEISVSPSDFCSRISGLPVRDFLGESDYRIGPGAMLLAEYGEMVHSGRVPHVQ